MSVFVTGATGFVGRAVLARLLRGSPTADSPAVRALTRRADHVFPNGVEPVVVDDIAAVHDWTPLLRDVRSVIHLAARVHVMREAPEQSAALYHSVNTEATIRLARDAAKCGVTRFVFLSSIKVLGEHTERGEAFTEASSTTGVSDAYGRSKRDAEVAIQGIAEDTGMECVIVRSPLVYGPGVGANFDALVRLVQRGWPLPFGAINNRRSLIAVENLADFLVRCVEHRDAANQTFVISDGEDVSTPELVRRIAHARGTPARLFPVPDWLLLAAAGLLGKSDAARRLLESLQVDSMKARQRLGWSPPLSVDEQLRRTVVRESVMPARGAGQA